MADEEFILDTEETTPAARYELTGWEDVIFELADEEIESG
jgi:hypothetical protein